MVTTQENITETKNRLQTLISELDALPSIPQAVLKPQPFQVLYPVLTYFNRKIPAVISVSPEKADVFKTDEILNDKVSHHFEVVNGNFYRVATIKDGVKWDDVTSQLPCLFFETEKEADDYILTSEEIKRINRAIDLLSKK